MNDITMVEKNIPFTYTEYENLQELPEADRELVLKAREAALVAYAPYSKFRVGAALKLKNGKIITGSNQENAAFPSGLCAERVALFAAHHQYPEVAVETIAITAQSFRKKINNPISPCGACRQVISESEKRFDQPIKLILTGEKGVVYVFNSVDSLLPFGFSSKDL